MFTETFGLTALEQRYQRPPSDKSRGNMRKEATDI